jgi:hypothetical protein
MDHSHELSRHAESIQTYWLGLDALFEYDRMPSWHTAKSGDFLVSKEPKVTFFISHPWQSSTMPDPNGEQWCTLRLLFRHLLGVHGPVPLRDGGLLVYSGLFPPSFQAYATKIDIAMGLSHHSSTGLRSAHHAVHRISVNESIEKLAQGDLLKDQYRRQLRKNVCLWIDYCCLPQEPRSPEEQCYFEHALPQLTYLAAHSTVIALWPCEADQCRRAWCLAEATIQNSVTSASLVRVDKDNLLDFDIPITLSPPGKYAPSFVDVTSQTAQAIDSLLIAARSARTSDDIMSCLREQGVECTELRDLPLLSAALFAAAAPPGRIGWRAVLINTASVTCELIWWVLALPVVCQYPLNTLTERAGIFFVDEADMTDRGYLIRFTSWILMSLSMLLFGALTIMSVLLLFCLLPINLIHRWLHNANISVRGKFIAKVAFAGLKTEVR